MRGALVLVAIGGAIVGYHIGWLAALGMVLMLVGNNLHMARVLAKELRR